MIDPEIGFTSDVIRDPIRFVGRRELIRDCITALNSSLSLIAVYGKRGVGKSSLLRQVQQMALGDYTLARNAGLQHLIPSRPRRYLTIYYTCDGFLRDGVELIRRLINDQDPEDGLLRLVPDDGKELVEFARSKEVSGGSDLKVVKWGAKGVDSTRYARVVPADDVQTFRNFLSSVVAHQVRARMKRDALLVLLDEVDVINDKSGIGSLIKSLSTETVKFGICGIANDLNDLVADHASVERLLEAGALKVNPMPEPEAEAVITTAEHLFRGQVTFDATVRSRIVTLAEGYPYLIQLLGKECVHVANERETTRVTLDVFGQVLDGIRNGTAFPTLEAQYQRAIGESEGRQILLHLLAEQPADRALFNDEVGRVVLKKIRGDAKDLNIDHVDQLVPRLIDKNFASSPESVGDFWSLMGDFRCKTRCFPAATVLSKSVRDSERDRILYLWP
ncbi:MAG: AAA family ATPase [Planctomycetales bacterium]